MCVCVLLAIPSVLNHRGILVKAAVESARCALPPHPRASGSCGSGDRVYHGAP